MRRNMIRAVALATAALLGGCVVAPSPTAYAWVTPADGSPGYYVPTYAPTYAAPYPGYAYAEPGYVDPAAAVGVGVLAGAAVGLGIAAAARPCCYGGWGGGWHGGGWGGGWGGWHGGGWRR